MNESIRLFYFEGDSNGIEEWFEKHNSNITDDLKTEAMQWAAKTGESNFQSILSYEVLANSIDLDKVMEKF